MENVGAWISYGTHRKEEMCSNEVKGGGKLGDNHCYFHVLKKRGTIRMLFFFGVHLFIYTN